ncbi:MAG: carboxypeptidase-like regulatory domain-containing protein [Bacteroidales bacterium]|nr:carboxypeptidase-like regulatory domain-containing protein [Bacteroidales bacterium]
MLKQEPDSMMVGYAYTDDNGQYELSYSGENDDLLVSVSGLAIGTQMKKVKNKSQTVDFIVEEKEFQLNEVVVKAPKIYYSHDTLNYLVSAFSDENDVSIGEVLKKMPGIDVAESGEISYQGKSINKFYIENLDLLNGRYGIATQNISPKDISTVQILENHQPIKAIDSLQISDKAAINLKLKEGAKGVLALMLQAGIGAGVAPLLWDNELTAMYFTRKNQHIAVGKTNNTGNDLTNELRSFNTSLDLTAESFTHIVMPSPPDINKSRYLFNNSNAVVTNNLFTVGQNKEFNFNVIYYNDYEKRESEARSSYFLTSDSLLIVDENIRSSRNTNRLETEIRLSENSETRYLNNFFRLESLWENDNGTIWTEPTVNQQLRQPSIKMEYTFHWIAKTDKAGFEILSQNGFRNFTQNLTVSPGLYADRLNNGSPYSSVQQDVHANTFVSQNRFAWLSPFFIGKISVSPVLGFGF